MRMPAAVIMVCRTTVPKSKLLSAIHAAALIVFALFSLPISSSEHDIDTPTAPPYEQDQLRFSLKDIITAIQQYRDGKLLSKLAHPENLSYSHAHHIWEFASNYLSTTPYAGMLRVNQPTKTGHVNILILRNDVLANEAPQLACSCQFIPGTDTIICDDFFIQQLESFLDKNTQYDLNSIQDNQQEGKDVPDYQQMLMIVRGMHEQFLFEWLISHELGHLLAGHGRDSNHNQWITKDGITIGRDVEHEADLYYLARLQHNLQSQTSAMMGLSQLVTSLYADLVNNQYPDETIKRTQNAYMGARFDVVLKYNPNRHPPLIWRAIELANALSARYPRIIEDSYFNKIKSKLRLVQADTPSEPNWCQSNIDTVKDKNKKPISVQELVDYFEIDMLNGDFEWARDLLSRIAANNESTGKNSLYLKLAEAELKFYENGERLSLQAVLQNIEKMGTEVDETVRLYAESLKALISQIPKEKFTDTKETVNKLLQELLQVVNDNGNLKFPTKIGALRYYLQLWSLVRRNPDLLQIKAEFTETLLILSKDVFASMNVLLDKNFEDEAKYWLKKAKETYSREAILNLDESISALKALAQKNDWFLKKIEYQQLEIYSLEVRPNASPIDIAKGKIRLSKYLLGFTASGSVDYDRAIRELHDSLDLLEKAALSLELSGRKEEISEMRMIALNQIGWTYLQAGKESDAIGPLLKSIAGRAKMMKGNHDCNTENDSQRAHTLHNLSDAYLSIGEFQLAHDYATEAFECREQMGEKFKAAELRKTIGFSLIELGEKDAGIEQLTRYVSEIKFYLDDEFLPEQILVAKVGGKIVSIAKLIDVNKVTPLYDVKSFLNSLRETGE